MRSREAWLVGPPWEGAMVGAPDPIDAADALARHGAVFAFVHGSRARGTQRPDSDVDVAAYFHDPAPASFELDLPPGADLLVLNDAPLEIAGRIALEGVLILDRDPDIRADWVARTRTVYADEKYRLDRGHREFLEAVGGADHVWVASLLRSVAESVATLEREQSAGGDRQADPLWLPGIKYLMIAAVEASIDIAQHICSTEGWGPPRDNADAMIRLGEREVVTPLMAERMRQAVGFRNILVHEYGEVDDAMVLARLADLRDLRTFTASVAAWLQALH